MTHQLKLKRAIEKGNFFKGSATVKAITEQLPNKLLENLSSTDLALVLDVINSAYQKGKNEAGAEMIDSNVVWINSLNKAIEWNEVGAEYKLEQFEEENEYGRKVTGTRMVKIKTGTLQLKFVD